MISQTDIQSIQQALDNGVTYTFTVFGSTRILQKVGGYYTLYEPGTRWHTPTTIEKALANLWTWRTIQFERENKRRAKRFTFETVIAKKRSA